MIRDEQDVRSFNGWQGYAHVRVWQLAPDQVTVVISGLGGGCTLEKLLPLLFEAVRSSTSPWVAAWSSTWSPAARSTISRISGYLRQTC